MKNNIRFLPPNQFLEFAFIAHIDTHKIYLAREMPNVFVSPTAT